MSKQSRMLPAPPLFRLTPAQVHVLMLLDDGPAEDSVGMELEDFRGQLAEVAERLSRMGLVETRFGWRFTLWFRLTVKGRNLLRTGVR
jgi:DNA-binding MarR family transcriptional regulator